MQQSAIQKVVTVMMVTILTKKQGRRRRGAGQGDNEVEEDDNQGACDHLLDTAYAREKEAGGWKSKKDIVDELELLGQAKAIASVG